LTEEILTRDHEFWAKYSERLIGNWITYDTPIKDIVKFAEDTYLRRNFANFKGDPKFARDDQAQKAFSKLRSSIGGVFAWRVNQATSNLMALQSRPPQEQAALRSQIEHWSAVRDRMIKETDFAFRQAFAFCPYSPEAVFRYCQLLISLQRYDEAFLIAETCRKLDPYNAQVVDLASRLRSARTSGGANLPPPPAVNLAQLEKELADHPTNFQTALNLAATYLSVGQSNRATTVLDGILNHPKADASAILAVAQAYVSMGDYLKLESTLEKLVKVAPTQAEAWYDLAAMKATIGKTAEALPALKQALLLSAERLKRDPKQRDLRAEAMKDGRFGPLAQNPEFKTLVATP
jgi:tetratricopeptide (TPR) repeat protein